MKEIKFCKNHPEKKAHSGDLCRSCYNKYLCEKNPEYAERQRENSRKWHQENKEKLSLYYKEYREKNPVDSEEEYFRWIKRKYGVSKEEYTNLLNECHRKCKLCHRPPHKGKRLHLDHCHTSKKIRGLLCTRCNWYLHTIEKDKDILERIKTYLNYE